MGCIRGTHTVIRGTQSVSSAATNHDH